MFLKLIIGSFILTLVSCSGHTFKKMESIDSKMARFNSRDKNPNIIPHFISSNEKIKKIKNSRTPASNTKKSSFENLTNKKLYFSTLYNQYQNLKQVSTQSAPEINSCPHFHTTMITILKDKPVRTTASNIYKKYSLDKFHDDKYLSTNPELLLPVTSESAQPRVVDIIKSHSDIKGQVQNAMAIHLNKTYKELRRLCEYGSSTNYYNFENLMGMKELNLNLPSEKNMDILLKTTLFSNMTLITSLKKSQASRSIASLQLKRDREIQKPLFRRLKVNWVEAYLR